MIKYMNDFLIELRLHEGRRSPMVTFGFAFDFLQFSSVKALIIFTIYEICPADHLKAEIFLSTCNFLFSSSTSNSTKGNAINLARKIPFFFCSKTARNRIELRQNLYLSMPKLSNMSRSVACW